MAGHLAAYGELKLDAELRQLLANISIMAVKRLLKKRGKSEAKLAFRNSPSHQQKQLSRIIPIQRIDWQIEELATLMLIWFTIVAQPLGYLCVKLADGGYCHWLG